MTHYKIFLRIVCAVVLSLLLGKLPLYATELKWKLPAPTKIAKHSYAWIGPLEGPNKKNQGYRMNMGFVVGDKAVLVIDTGYHPQMAKQMIQHIRHITALPIKYAINSNSQAHRFFGNSVFSQAGAKIISHPLEKQRMQRLAGIFSSIIEKTLGLNKNSIRLPQLPTILVKNNKTIDLGGLNITIKHFGASHTPASLVVIVNADKLIYAGDILFSGRLLAILSDGNINSWIKTYHALRQYKGVRFVPGHGKVSRLSAFDFPTLSYLNLLHNSMEKNINNGIDIQPAIESLDQSAFKHLINFKQLSGRNASRAYLEAEIASFD